MTESADQKFMTRALHLAAQGLNTTTPNPRVGCVLVRDGAIVGEGWHKLAGGPHAEIHALHAAGDAARGATAYVTLEPCAHYGRTPPCVDALIDAGVARVVAAMRDPNPQVAGEGLARLEMATIKVECGLMEEFARKLNVGFVSRMTRGRPWVRVKLAASVDGRTALMNGRSQWITSREARHHAHVWRARSCAIMTGSGTVLADDPNLTVREVPCQRQPLRVVIDGRLQTPTSANVLAGGGSLVYSTKEGALPAEVVAMPGSGDQVDLTAVMNDLGQRGINDLLVEGGARLSGALLAAGLVDEFLIYQAPLLIGDPARGMFDVPELADLAQAIRLDVVERKTLGPDLFLRARLQQA
jgi:diaminohydroxyphosphoribosylaminopyrimidine deaminase/5-amino-6-(5-phosphoribosylamino)uracil reductase